MESTYEHDELCEAEDLVVFEEVFTPIQTPPCACELRAMPVTETEDGR